MNENPDPFDPKNLALSPEQIAASCGKRLVWNKTAQTFVEPKDAPISRNAKFTYVQLPIEKLGKLAAVDGYMPLLILVRLEELWFTQFKRNPVKLGGFEVGGIKISRFRKTRALHKLEAAGLVLVERKSRKSPLVTLLWRPKLK